MRFLENVAACFMNLGRMGNIYIVLSSFKDSAEKRSFSR